MKLLSHRPTFEMLLEKRRLAVINPENKLRFVISLRDWERCLWAVRVVRHEPSGRPPDSFETAHRLLSRDRIEEWLAWLVLDPKPQRGLALKLRDWISPEERSHERRLKREVSLGRLPSRCAAWCG